MLSIRFIRICVVGLLLSAAPGRWGLCQIEGFTESFTGTGDYQSAGGLFDGLDNPDWFIGGVGTLTDRGYQFTLDSEPEGGRDVREEINRQLIGQGSYFQQIILGDLQFREITQPDFDTFASITIDHEFITGDHASRVVISLGETAETDGTWLFTLGTLTPRQTQRIQVPRGDQLSIGLGYDQLASTVTASYDNDILDGVSPIEIVLPASVELSQENAISLVISTGGQGSVEGVLHSWSVKPLSDVLGDFNANDVLDVADIDLLTTETRDGTHDTFFDLNDDSLVNDTDRTIWVHDLKQTSFGDANLNGSFDSADLVNVFRAGEYDDDITLNSTWMEGDWNGDGDFDSGDLVSAFQDGGYVTAAMPAIPEPTSLTSLLAGLVVLVAVSNTRRNRV